MSGKKGFGAVLEYDSTGGGVWVAIANLTKIRPFHAKADVIDVTSMSSAGQFREKLSGLLDSGEVQADLNYDDKAASHAWMLANLGVVTPFRVSFPQQAPAAVQRASFSGFISAVPPEIPMDNKMTCSPVITISGAVTVA